MTKSSNGYSVSTAGGNLLGMSCKDESEIWTQSG